MADNLFNIANTFALILWLLLIILPRWKFTRLLVISGSGVLIFAGMYVLWLLLNLGQMQGSFDSLQGLAEMFASPDLVLVGWLHYLAFDLFVGIWIRQDADRAQVSQWLVVPCQLFTFMLGPSGLLIYWLGRGATKNQWRLFNGGKQNPA